MDYRYRLSLTGRRRNKGLEFKGKTRLFLETSVTWPWPPGSEESESFPSRPRTPQNKVVWIFLRFMDVNGTCSGQGLSPLITWYFWKCVMIFVSNSTHDLIVLVKLEPEHTNASPGFSSTLYLTLDDSWWWSLHERFVPALVFEFSRQTISRHAYLPRGFQRVCLGILVIVRTVSIGKNRIGRCRPCAADHYASLLVPRASIGEYYMARPRWSATTLQRGMSDDDPSGSAICKAIS